MERERANHFFSSGVSNNPRHMSTGEAEKRRSRSVSHSKGRKNKLMCLNQFPLHKERRNISGKSNRCSRCWANVTVADYLSPFFLPDDGGGREDIPLRRTKVPRYPPPLPLTHYLPKRREGRCANCTSESRRVSCSPPTEVFVKPALLRSLSFIFRKKEAIRHRRETIDILSHLE